MIRQANYTNLPIQFYQTTAPLAVASPDILLFNEKLALELSLVYTNPNSLLGYLSGNQLFPDTKPIATAYAGHQYGHFVNQLGDGRAHLIADIISPDGQSYEIQLKGSGRTRFSRQGDGRCALGPAVREYLISEYMHTLDIPTTRSLSVVTSGEMIQRETLLPGAIISRVSKSHLRIGHFEYFYAQHDLSSLKTLIDYAISNLFPEIQSSSNEPYNNFFSAVCDLQAELISHWMSIGFVHGVMNTDNTSIVGETIDYGPCAFINQFDLEACFSSIDKRGRYAFGNQAQIAAWNLSRLANCVHYLITELDLEYKSNVYESLEYFPNLYDQNIQTRFECKLGLSINSPGNKDIIHDLIALMNTNRVDITKFFYMLINAVKTQSSQDLCSSDSIHDWFKFYIKTLNDQYHDLNDACKLMTKHNPCYIPRNHLVQAAIDDLLENNCRKKLDKLAAVLKKPFTMLANDQHDQYFNPINSGANDYVTYCGT